MQYDRSVRRPFDFLFLFPTTSPKGKDGVTTVAQ